MGMASKSGRSAISAHMSQLQFKLTDILGNDILLENLIAPEMVVLFSRAK